MKWAGDKFLSGSLRYGFHGSRCPPPLYEGWFGETITYYELVTLFKEKLVIFGAGSLLARG
jgi:hypothetical protein